MTKFEYDQAKSSTNQEKHGISFESAQELWTDPNLLEVRAQLEDEPRFLVIGTIKSKHWSAVITYRCEVVRIISVRRSRKNEVELYES